MRTLPLPGKAPAVRTFHEHGVTELRITALIDEKRVDIHILDVEAVIAATKKAGASTKILESFVSSCRAAAKAYPDGHKLEITPYNLTGEDGKDEEE